MLTNRLKGASLSQTSLPIEYVGSYVTGFAGSASDITITFGGNLTGGIDSSASAGDMVLVYFGIGTQGNVNLSVSGYTNITQVTRFFLFDFGCSLLGSYKFMGPTPDTTLTLVGGTRNANHGGTVVVQVWRNVNFANPFSAAATTAGTMGTVIANPPAITPTITGSYIVSGAVGGSNQGNQTYSSSDLTDFRSTTGNDNIDATIGVGYKQWTSGSFDPAAFTFSGSDAGTYSYVALTIALRPS